MELPQPGEQFEGAYQLSEVLGEGGFAVVFGATELGMAGRRVAIKVLKPEKGGRYPGDVEPRFTREVRMLSQLQSPHTVTLYRYGKTASGLLYLVFEYVPGMDLDEFMHARRLTAEEVVQIVRQLLDALREAHANGLLHRDIKPANIRIDTSRGREELFVKLLDFGIAKPVLVGPDGGLTKTGEMLGTPRYMSPEQLTEEALTPASDVYSLGVVAFEMLSGGAMHGPGWSDQLDRLHSGHVFSIPELERIGPGLNQIVTRMTARKLHDRYQTADQVLRALEELELGRTIPERPRPTADEVLQLRRAAPTAAEIEFKAPETSGGRWAAIILVVALVALAVAVFSLSADPSEPELRTPANDRQPALARAPAKSPTKPPPAPSGETTGPRPTAPTANVASPGCGLEAPFYGTDGHRVRLGIDSAMWTVHIPKDYDADKAHPLLILFQNDITSGAQIIRNTQLDQLADREGFIVLAPESPVPVWRTQASASHVLPLAVHTANQLCVDPQRVYLVGHGIGGSAAEWLSCESWVAAVATNGFRREDLPYCQNADPVPFFHLAPVDSVRIPVNGGRGCTGWEWKPPLADFERVWRTRNECGESRQVHVRYDDHVCYAWDDCDAPFVSCHLKGGHAWQGSGIAEPSLALLANCDEGPPGDFPTSEVLWEFLKQQKLSDEATPAW